MAKGVSRQVLFAAAMGWGLDRSQTVRHRSYACCYPTLLIYHVAVESVGLLEITLDDVEMQQFRVQTHKGDYVIRVGFSIEIGMGSRQGSLILRAMQMRNGQEYVIGQQQVKLISIQDMVR